MKSRQEEGQPRSTGAPSSCLSPTPLLSVGVPSGQSPKAGLQPVPPTPTPLLLTSQAHPCRKHSVLLGAAGPNAARRADSQRAQAAVGAAAPTAPATSLHPHPRVPLALSTAWPKIPPSPGPSLQPHCSGWLRHVPVPPQLYAAGWGGVGAPGAREPRRGKSYRRKSGGQSRGEAGADAVLDASHGSRPPDWRWDRLLPGRPSSEAQSRRLGVWPKQIRGQSWWSSVLGLPEGFHRPKCPASLGRGGVFHTLDLTQGSPSGEASRPLPQEEKEAERP